MSERGTFAALRHHNSRLFFGAQVLSTIGTWVQITVENWLVLELSHSGLALGVTNALQFGPSVVLGLYGGVVADRFDRQKVLLVTQGTLGLIALAVGLLAGVGVLRIWVIWAAAGALGLVKCFDLPALQGFAKDLVGAADLPNAVAWSNAISACGRMVGPVVGGLVLTGLGVAPGFLINAASFGLVVAALMLSRREEMVRRAPVTRETGQIREGLAYVCSDRVLAVTTIVMTVVFAAAFNFQISLGLIAFDTLAGGSRTYGAVMSALGCGAVVGSLVLARYAWFGVPAVLLWAGALAVAQLAVAAMQSLLTLLAATFVYGVSAGLFGVTVISTLQVRATDAMRGRVMAIYAICFLGSSPMGGPAFGMLAASLGVSGALRVEAGICGGVALVAALAWRSICRVRGTA